MNLNKKSRQSGFTLIELLAVVAILGILAGIAIPRVLGAIETARLNADHANIAMLQSAVERWAMDRNPADLAAWQPLTLGAAAPSTTASVAIETATPNPLFPAYLLALPSSPSGTTVSYQLIFVDLDGTGTGTRHSATVVRVPAFPTP